MKTTLVKRIIAFLLDLSCLVIAFLIFKMFENPVEIFENKIDILNENYMVENISLKEYFFEVAFLYKSIYLSNVHVIFLNIVYIFFYFVLLPYYNNGQTIGKKVIGIKVKGMANQNPKLNQLFTRSIVTSGLLYLMFLILFLFLPFNYFISISIAACLQCCLIIITILMIFIRKDRRGLHDIISKTRVLNVR